MNDLIKRSDAIEAMKPCKHVIFTDKTGNATNIASAINSIPAVHEQSERIATVHRKLAIAHEALMQASRHLDLLAPNSTPTKMVSKALFKIKEPT